MFVASIAAIIFVAPSPFVGSAIDQLPRGEVIEKVACKSDPQQSYAAFLPSHYTPEKQWPILYAFDPVSRGKLPVTLFKDAAEKYGFIVVGSNNSRNGIQVSPIVEALWKDTHQRFSIDARRVYTTGFSGGARVACAVALMYPGVAGVIACSGGFPPQAKPSAETNFVFFGTAGTEDFNFPEMRQLSRKLDAAGVTNELAIFEGGHDWAPQNLCSEAIGWMEIQAMKAGTRAKDDALIGEIFSEKIREVRGYEAAQKPYEAYVGFESLVAEFRGLRDVKEYELSAERLGALREVKAVIKDEKSQEEKQAILMMKLQTLVAQLKDPATHVEVMSQLKTVISDLTKRAQGINLGERRVARRVLRMFFVQLYEESNVLYEQKKFALVPEKLEIAAAVKPKDPYVFYNLAAAYARLGNKSKAIDALGRALENGFTDMAAIEQNQDFASLRNEAEYQRILATYTLKK